jgi:hypothetical protein
MRYLVLFAVFSKPTACMSSHLTATPETRNWKLRMNEKQSRQGYSPDRMGDNRNRKLEYLGEIEFMPPVVILSFNRRQQESQD